MRMLFCAIVATGFPGFYCAMRASPGTAGLSQWSYLTLSLKRPGWPGRLVLLDDLGDDTGPDRAATLPDGEAEALVHGDRLDQLDLHRHVVAGHNHLRPRGELGHTGDVGCPEVELRPVAGEERRMAPALLLLEDVHLGLELGVGRDRAGLAEHLPALDVLALDAAEETADVVAGLPLVEDLAEHLHAGDDRGIGLRVDTDDLDRVAVLDDA